MTLKYPGGMGVDIVYDNAGFYARCADCGWKSDCLTEGGANHAASQHMLLTTRCKEGDLSRHRLAFDNHPVCTKCGCDDVKLRYSSRKEIMSLACFEDCPPGEHLHVVCLACQYGWTMAVLDS